MISQEKKTRGVRKAARGLTYTTLLLFLLVSVLLLIPVITFCFLILLTSLFIWKLFPKAKQAENSNS